MRDMDVHNTSFLENGGLKLTYTSKIGVALTLCLGIGFGAVTGCYSNNDQHESPSLTTPTRYEENIDIPMRDQVYVSEDEEIVPYEQEAPINVSLEEVNSLNIIINDSNCREDFINSVCEELDRDGIKFKFTRDSKDINVNDAVIITLDQQYMAGPATVVFAPLENGRNGNSDALTLAAEKAFYEKGFLIDGVACGQIGFRENENGTVSERIPTETESAIDTNKNTSFVTISFGTQNTHAGLTASAIEAMLTRYYAYINSDYGQEDLIYCVEEGEDYEDIANKIGTTPLALDEFNDTADESVLLTGEAIINPISGVRREFNKHVPTNLYIDKTIWSK